MEIKRVISKKITDSMQFSPILVLTGARQTGKTTLLRELLPTHTYVSLDLPSEASQAEKSPAEFLSRYPRPLLVDEVQYAPGLFRHLKAEVDQRRDQPGQIVLTGSQKFHLMKEVSESLAGRALLFDLESLSFEEIRSWRPQAPLNAVETLLRGTYPELWRVPDYPKGDYYRSYVTTYLERDVRQILNVGSLRDFERFVRLCAAQNGRLLDKSDLAKSLGINVRTVTAWLSVLETSGVVSLLEPYFENLGKRIIKSPKLYFNDTGLLGFLLGLENSIPDAFSGMIWETHVYAELRKWIKNRGLPYGLWFYRDTTDEVDFMVTSGTQAALIECKWGERPSTADARPMRRVTDLVRKNRGLVREVPRAWIACRAASPAPLDEDIEIVNGFYMDERLAKLF